MNTKIVSFTDECGRMCYAVAIPFNYSDEGEPLHWHECGLEQSLLGPEDGVEVVADFDRIIALARKGG